MKPEEIAAKVCNTHLPHNGGLGELSAWCLCDVIATALRTYGESEYQRGRREADAELYLRGRTEALEEAAQAVRMQTTGYPALEAGLVERILSLAGAPHPSSEYQRGLEDAAKALPGCYAEAPHGPGELWIRQTDATAAIPALASKAHPKSE